MRFIAFVTFAFLLAAHLSPAEDLAPLKKPTSKPRVIISTDAGGNDADDIRSRRHLTVTKPPVKPGQDLAPRQITRGTENHKVEWLDRDNTRNHFCLSTLAKSAPLALTDFRAPAIYAAAAQVQQKRRMRCHGCMAQSNSNITEAPNHAVMPPLSKGGETSTRSAPMISSPRRARTHWIASKLVGPPTSGVPVPGA